jgi:hypothetical protein
MKCEDCTSRDCSKKGHVRGGEITKMGDKRRRFECSSCGHPINGPFMCERCGHDIVGSDDLPDEE